MLSAEIASDGVALVSVAHPSGPKGRRPRLKKASIETVEVELPAPEERAADHGLKIDLVRTHIHLDKAMMKRIDAEWHRRELPSRNETIRALLAEALK